MLIAISAEKHVGYPLKYVFVGQELPPYGRIRMQWVLAGCPLASFPATPAVILAGQCPLRAQNRATGERGIQ